MSSPLGERPSMVGLPPTSLARKEVKSPGKRGRKRKHQQESESDLDLTVDESNPTTPAALTDSVNEDGTGTDAPPPKKRRGRPPEATSARARKEKEKEKREKDKEKKAKRKLEPKPAKETEIVNETEQEQEVEATEEAESETGEESGKNEKSMPETYLRGYTSFQLFCDFILRKLMIKDPEEYFTYPVSPQIAPDYHQIITNPMDFFTIRKKLDNNEYTNLVEFRADAQKICENAMEYNNPHTIFYIAAQKMSNVVKYYLGEEYLEYLRYSLPFGKDVERSVLGLPEKDIPARKQTVATEPRPTHEIQRNEMVAKKLLADAPPALRKKLTTEVPKWPMGYIDNHEGAVALNIVTTTEKTRIPLGDMIGKIESGHPGLLNSFEDTFPALIPSSYLNYEPFASFAPMYDTTWATMNQRDSDLLTQVYGDRENAADVLQLRQMVADSGGYFLDMIDNMLDSLTEGEHSRTIEALKTSENEALKQIEACSERPTTPTSFRKLLDDVATLENIGLDTSFIEDIKAECGLTELTATPEEEIERNGYMLNDLIYLQDQRLTRNVTNLADVPDVSEAEVDLAARIATNFQHQIIEFKVVPNEMVSNHDIHNAIGINEEDDDGDYDILREFMDI